MRPHLFGAAQMGTEKCPFCGQEIDSEATRCFFCGAKLDEEAVEKRLEQLYIQEDQRFIRGVDNPLVLKVIAILILIYVVLFHGEPSGRQSPAVMGPMKSSTIRLNAKVTFAGSQLVISNNDAFEWENVRLEITSGLFRDSFSLSVPKLYAGQTYAIKADEFLRKDGARFDPASARPWKFSIYCDIPGKKNISYMAYLQ